MGSKTKKDALDSLAFLEKYMRRDQTTKGPIARIQRYVSELRQSHSSLKSEVDSLEQSVGKLADARADASKQLAARTEELRVERTAHQQDQADLAAAKKRIAELEKEEGERNAIDTSGLDHGLDDIPEYKNLLKLLQRSWRRAPDPDADYDRSDYLYMFDIRRLVDGYSTDDCLKVGQFVLATCMTGFPLGFYARQEHKIDKDKLGHDVMVRYLRWTKRWIARSGAEKRFALPTDKEYSDAVPHPGRSYG